MRPIRIPRHPFVRTLASALLAALSSSPLALAQAPTAPPQPTPDSTKTAPDLVIFQNGDQLTGKLLRATDGNLSFHSDMAGDLTIPLSKVKELRSAGSFAVLRKNENVTGAVVQPGTVHVADGKVSVTSAGQTIETLPAAAVGYIVDAPTFRRETDPHPSLWYGWNGNLTAGATLVRATQTGTTLTAGAALVRAFPTVPYLPPRNRTTLNLAETYGTSRAPAIPPTVPATPDAVVKTSIFHFDAEQDEYLTRKFYLLGDASLDHNFSLGLQLQQIYGLGIGWTPISTPKQQLDLKFDSHFERQSFFEPPVITSATPYMPNQNLFGSTFGESYRRNFSRGIVFTETGNVIPSWTYLNAYSANITAGVALPIWKRLAANVSSTDNFINNPSQYYKKNSFQFVTGLSYSIH